MNTIKKIFPVILTIVFLLIPKNVYAQKCSEEQTEEFNTMIKNIKIEYIYDKDNLFKVKMTNIPKEIVVVDNNGVHFSYNSDNSSINDGYVGGEKYSFKFLPMYYDCELDKTYTKTVTINKYNEFSEKEECEKYKDFTYCKESLSVTITEDEFYSELEKYKIKINKPKYIFLVICSVNLIALIVVYFMLNRKKKKEENIINDFIK